MANLENGLTPAQWDALEGEMDLILEEDGWVAVMDQAYVDLKDAKIGLAVGRVASAMIGRLQERLGRFLTAQELVAVVDASYNLANELV